MDLLTHTLAGLAMSRAGLRRLTPHATALVLLAANAADIDVVSAFGGSTSYLHYHRHITHALVMIPILAALPVLVVRLFARKPFDWKRAWLVSAIGAASHPLLDWTNVYGIRLLLPFSSEWLRLDITSVVDVWIWAVLLMAALAPGLSRLVSSEIGAKPGSGRGAAILALALLPCYEAGRYFLHQRALAVLDSRLYDGVTPARVAAFPGPLNPFRWRGLVETGGFYKLFQLDLLTEFDPAGGVTLYKPQPGPREAAAASAARQTEAFRVFLDFSQFPLWRFTPLESGTRVEVLDLRFGAPPQPRFVASAVVNSAGRVEESSFSFQPNPARRP